MTDRFASFAATPTSPARKLTPIVPSDTFDLPSGPARLFVTAASTGALRVIPAENAENAPVDLVITPAHQNAPLQVFVRRVLVTGTDPAMTVYAVEE